MEDTYIRFDWAMKHMLRDKANFDILEGFVSVLLGEEIKIEEILESESNLSRCSSPASSTTFSVYSTGHARP